MGAAREKKRRQGVAERTMSHWQPSLLISCNVCQWCHIQWAKANKIIHIGISFSPLTFHHLTGKLLLLSLHTNWLHISFIIKFIFASLDNRRLNNQMHQNRPEERMCWRRCCWTAKILQCILRCVWNVEWKLAGFYSQFIQLIIVTENRHNFRELHFLFADRSGFSFFYLL